MSTPSPAPALTTSLQAVHAEIRAQVNEARRLASRSTDAAAPASVETIHAFFAGAWPRYVAAKQALIERLAGRDGAVDGVLGEVRRGLDEQGVLVERLVELTTPSLAATGDRVTELGAVAATLERRLDEELGDEERLVHPALERLLPGNEQGELAQAFRQALG